jgi:putative ABC transport system permease protein
MSPLTHVATSALDSLRAHPLRTSLSMLGIVMGAASLAAVLALGDGAQQFAREQVEREGMNLVVAQPITEDVIDGLRVPRPSFPLFTAEDADRVSAAIGPVASVLLQMEGTGLVQQPGQRARAARVRAVLATGGPPTLPALADGRTLSADEMKNGEPVAIVSARLYELLAPQAAGGVARTVTLGSTPHTIVGRLAPFAGEREFLAVVPYGDADRAMVPAQGPRARSLLLRAPRVEDVPAAKRALEDLAARRDDWRGAVRIEATGAARLQQVAKGILVFKMLMGAFTAISLLVGGIGITNVLLASMLERTREIGIRKAVGARHRDVLLQFLVESVSITTVGALAGAALGMVGAVAVTAIIRSTTEVPIFAAMTWQTAAVSAGAAVIVGLLAGTYPALRAARLTPVEAIQRE